MADAKPDIEDALKGIVDNLRRIRLDCEMLRTKAQARIAESWRAVEICDGWIKQIDAAIQSRVAAEALPDIKRIAGYEAFASRPKSALTTPHKEIIADILRRAGRSLPTSAIAHQAFKEGTITSSKGYRGVYSSVTTTLKRYEKHLFVRARQGLWDLRERRFQAKASSATITTPATPQPTLN